MITNCLNSKAKENVVNIGLIKQKLSFQSIRLNSRTIIAAKKVQIQADRLGSAAINAPS